MPVTDPTILTVILNYRTPDLAIRAARAAVREMRALGGEVVIVDNASGDGSFAELHDAARMAGWMEGGLVRVIEAPENGGFGAGNNLGIRLGLSTGAMPDFVYLLNSDAWPDPGAVRQLFDHMHGDPCVGVAGSYIKGVDGTPHCTLFRFPSIAGEFESAARTGPISKLLKNSVVPMEIPAVTTRVDWVAGASMMLRRKMLDEIGMFDENFFLYFEETELCHRAARAGWKTSYVLASEVTHVGSASTGLKTWDRTPCYWFDSRLYYFTKVHGRAYAALATLARIAGGVIWRLRRLVSGRPPADPPRFLRDLIAHALGAVFRRGRARMSAPIARQMMEEGE